jgi:hypothetical protein
MKNPREKKLRQERLLDLISERPNWMNDPALLPKAPPPKSKRTK